MDSPAARAGIRILRGRIPAAHHREFLELSHYESGRAEADARAVSGAHEEPWLNVLATSEPAVQRALDRVLADEALSARIRGAVLDVGAGTCWLSARVSRLDRVSDVYAVDLSERFLTGTGVRLLTHFGAAAQKITLVVSDFNELPLPDASIDCALLFASLHHSLSPIKTLQEVGRCVRPGGTVMVLENPAPAARISGARRRALALSEAVTEIAYTRAELEYLFANAAIGPWQTHRMDVLSRPGIRRMVRRVVRAAGLEDVVLNPPAYLFVVDRR